MGDETNKELRKAGMDSSLVNNDSQSDMDLARELGEEEIMTALSCELSEESDETESPEDPEQS
ncbi:hypothetical protein N7449_000977 [Penicillium cf. viridicatum]|uniref:Uncharacterized protein n=1 Tax=Penicillium cf. viridicatum TaxID=2972119 RepID=A0A9W9N5X2_9EURO|nr:hypothetical protein N7449_000977 [Penicillium cf. viridicatum]